MPHQIGCKHCKEVSQKQFGKKISTSQERTQTTSLTMFAPSTSNQKERTSLARQEAKTSTSNHGTISSLNCPNWKLWAYTDGSYIGKAENFTDAGVCILPSNQSWMLCGLRRRGNDNTINRAELAGIAASAYQKVYPDCIGQCMLPKPN